MDCKGLQINDWLYDCHDYYNRGREKKPIQLDRESFVDLLCDYTSHNDLDLGCMYQPIPLTAEILEKNGWVHLMPLGHYDIDIDIQGDKDYAISFGRFAIKGYIHLWWHPHNDGIRCWHIDVCHLPSMSRFEISLQYVHELQRALRMCGLWELADNFKVV